MKPLVSICIPAYNEARFIHKCLDSALTQTFADFELVLVDNGSTDETFAIAESYAERHSRIRLYRNNENLGVIGNLNRCVELAQGEWLKFLCADDWLEPNCLVRMLDARRPGVPLVVCRRSIAFEGDTPEAERQGYLKYWSDHNLLPGRFHGLSFISAEAFAEHMVRDPTFNCIGDPNSIMVHHAAFDRFGWFNPDLITHQDWEFCARVAVHTGLSYVDDSLATLRVHGRSETSIIRAHQRFNMEVIAPLMIRHELAYAPVYAPVRAAAHRCEPPVDLRREFHAFARKARLLAHEYAKHGTHRDPNVWVDWDKAVRRYPRILSFSPRYFWARHRQLLGRLLQWVIARADSRHVS